jgi:hypothetical protein
MTYALPITKAKEELQALDGKDKLVEIITAGHRATVYN